jgi:hypothetical protein
MDAAKQGEAYVAMIESISRAMNAVSYLTANGSAAARLAAAEMLGHLGALRTSATMEALEDALACRAGADEDDLSPRQAVAVAMNGRIECGQPRGPEAPAGADSICIGCERASDACKCSNGGAR